VLWLLRGKVDLIQRLRNEIDSTFGHFLYAQKDQISTKANVNNLLLHSSFNLRIQSFVSSKSGSWVHVKSDSDIDDLPICPLERPKIHKIREKVRSQLFALSPI